MSLCEACRSIPFRKLINSGADALRDDSFRFNEAGRIPSFFPDDLSWNERRCPVANIRLLARTCSLCAFILTTIENHTWTPNSSVQGVGWKEIESLIPRHLTIWMSICENSYKFPYLSISLGTSTRVKTNWLHVALRKPLGNLAMRRNMRRQKLIG